MQRALLKRAVAALTVVSATALCAVAGLVVVDIVRRAAIGVSLQGAVDLVQAGILIAAFAGLPVMAGRGGNIAVTELVERLPPPWPRRFEALAEGLSCLFFGAIAVYGAAQARALIAQGAVSQTLALPIAYYWVPFLLGCALASAVCAVRSVRLLQRRSDER